MTNDVKDEYQPVFNPDGKKIAFVRAGNIFVMNAHGTDQTQLTHSGKDHSPAYSPDNNFLAFVSYRDGKASIYIMNSDGTNQKKLTNDTRLDFYPIWK